MLMRTDHTLRSRLNGVLIAMAMSSVFAAVATAQTPLGTEFTYQGSLLDGGTPVNAAMDFRFRLFDAEVAGAQVGMTVEFDSVSVVDGLFTVDVDFGASPFNGDKRWLEISVRLGTDGGPDPYTILSPLQLLTAAPYARTAVEALNVTGVDGHSLDADDGAPTDALYVDNAGRVGIGTTTPSDDLHIVSGGPEVLIEATNSGAAGVQFINTDHEYSIRMTNGEKFVLRDVTNSNTDRLTIIPTGEVGIGTSNPETTLSIANGGNPVGITQGHLGGSAMELTTRDNAGGQATRVKINAQVADANTEFWTGARDAEIKYGQLSGNSSNGNGKLELFQNGSAGATLNGAGKLQLFDGNTVGVTLDSVGIINTGGELRLTNNADRDSLVMLASNGDGARMVMYNDAGSPKIILQAGDSNNEGVITTEVLEITGGSDIAEPFNVFEDAEPGMVVSIDPHNPGELRLTSHAYDRTVAGVISGAGGVKPGMMLTQKGTMADGKHPVALTGRVWCHVDATAVAGAVQPGDLLTTSDTPGHAMKVNDHTRAQGAIIGKAMTALESGRGLVLVLVSLQ